MYFDIDVLRQLLEPSGHKQRANSRPFKTPLYFFILYHALPPAIQFHLPSVFSLNACATVVNSTHKRLKTGFLGNQTAALRLK